MRYFFGAALMFYTLAVSDKANACWCAEAPLSANIRSNRLIATGKILSETRLSALPELSDMVQKPFRYNQYKVLVSHVYKGSITKNIIDVYTQDNGGDCGYEYAEVGSEYIFFLHHKVLLPFPFVRGYTLPYGVVENGDVSWIELCNGTRDYSDEYSADIRAVMESSGN